MSVIYLNVKRSDGSVETIDEFSFDPKYHKNRRDFRSYVSEMVIQYRDAGELAVYRSQRCTRDWRNK